ncbi:hypothetical protein SteCoe_24816 [Stentor coeruleus]|uniref:Uncharacterized protein n=1 Tax=Stentor coeruleus TaxID=5963 RepID=A0A1R2BGP3_9CILI|nr:hypothetical protein SteCoe_24816 [Stentor coeruleus]
MFVVRRSRALVRMFTSSNKGIEDVVKGKGKTEEDLYFSRKDKDTLKKLMDKLEHAIPDESHNPDALKKARDNLVGIIRKHNLRPTEGLVDDLMNWRVGH